MSTDKRTQASQPQPATLLTTTRIHVPVVARSICKKPSKGLLFDRFNLNLLFRLVKSTVQLNQALIKKQILTAETNSTLPTWSYFTKLSSTFLKRIVYEITVPLSNSKWIVDKRDSATTKNNSWSLGLDWKESFLLIIYFEFLWHRILVSVFLSNSCFETLSKVLRLDLDFSEIISDQNVLNIDY